MERTLDDKDKRIVGELDRDAKQTIKEISLETDIPVSTVQKRLKKLEEDSNRLKVKVAELLLENDLLKEINSKKW